MNRNSIQKKILKNPLFERGKLVLVPFPFTDLTAQKIRPALIVSRPKIRASDVIVAFVSSRETKKIDQAIVPIKANENNGLKSDSVVRCDKLATLDRKIVLGEIGKLDLPAIQKINQALTFTLGLSK